MIKKTYITIVNEEYKPYLEQLIKSHQLFSKINLIVFTINFDIDDINYKNIKFIKFTDSNLIEYDTLGSNKFIKNQYEKHKYTTLLKPKILQFFSEEYDYYFFIDVDILLTKNSDVLFMNLIDEYGMTDLPISVKYFYDYSTSHGGTEPLYDEYGVFNPKCLGYYPLIELYNSSYSHIRYLTTYCIFYSKNCLSFFKEVEEICFDEKVLYDYKKYLPLGDETVFNYLYSKYNFSESISSDLCYDVNPFMGIDSAINNLEKNKDFVSFIHTKRYTTLDPYGKNFSDTRLDEYQKIFDVLTSNDNDESHIIIQHIDKKSDCDIINFSVNSDETGLSDVRIVSLFRPNKEYKYQITLFDKNVIFFIVKENDLWVKDTYLIIEKNKIIKEVKKIL